jgi:hypothetical protein
MNLLSKETLIGAASLGAGAVAAKIVHKKLLPIVPVPAIADANTDGTASNIQNLITLGFGIFTPMIVKGAAGSTINAVGKGLGAGMIAVSVAGLITPLLGEKSGLTGYGSDTFMGDVLMGEAESGTLMGASDNMFSAASNDFTEGGAGEMDY